MIDPNSATPSDPRKAEGRKANDGGASGGGWFAWWPALFSSSDTGKAREDSPANQTGTDHPDAGPADSSGNSDAGSGGGDSGGGGDGGGGGGGGD